MLHYRPGNPLCMQKIFPLFSLCYAEVCFLKAEAALYGIGRAASTTDANTFYQNGIRAAMEVWGVAKADIDNFVAIQAEATLSGNQEDNFRKICTQAWLSFITNNYEAYNTVRRNRISGYSRTYRIRSSLRTWRRYNQWFNYHGEQPIRVPSLR